MGSMAIVKNIGTNWLYKKWVIGFSAKANYWISSLPYINENLRNSEINHLKKKGWKKVNYWIMLCCSEKLAGGSQKHAFMTSDASTSILLSGSIPSSIHVC